MQFIYPEHVKFRDSEHVLEIDDNDPEFSRDPTGLYAIYSGNEPVLLLQSTETEGSWDVILKIRRVHFEKLSRLFNEVLPHL